MTQQPTLICLLSCVIVRGDYLEAKLFDGNR